MAVETSVELLGNTQPLLLRANLSPRSAVALREDFVEAEAFGQRTLLPDPSPSLAPSSSPIWMRTC